ncbi:MAG TPA: TolC family protein [Kiritimatiellia bacterium]|nr:TolC family protein [Kiritimatiellia bacterium]HRU69610.1 TolC family protein [Kiritimatiellia bacterium]
MRRVWRTATCCAAGLIVLAAAGCSTIDEPDGAPSEPGLQTDSPVPAPTPSEPPAEGYDWDTLARMAAANCGEARALLLDAQAERSKTAVDTGWRNPRLRLGHGWSDQDNDTPGRSGMRTFPEEVDTPHRPFKRYREWDDRSFDANQIGLRLYTANPFVNRWLRKRGEAAARALEKESEEEAYAVFCEVKTLCLEADLLREEIELLERMAAIREKLRDLRREQSEAGVTSPLDLIRAETKLAAQRSEIFGKRMARQQLVRRIAVLAGVPVEGFRLKPRTADQTPAAASLDAAVLTDLAFMRRPDLARLEREKEAAEHAVRAARAGQIPWLEYVEGSFEDTHGDIYSYEEHFTGRDHTTRDETEWQIRIAMSLPVFNWLGDDIRLTRTQLAAAEARVHGQYERVRVEVGGVLEDYRAAQAEWARLNSESERLYDTMHTRIESLAQEPTIKREEVLAAHEELLAFRRVCLKAERECLFMQQCLETVSGGALPKEKKNAELRTQNAERRTP